MEVFLIRHTTPLIDDGLIYGSLDVPVCEDRFGEEKSQVLNRLPLLEKVYSSPSARCVRLAEAISKKVWVDIRLQEYNFGQWEGKNWNTINPDETQVWMKDFVNVRPPGGESMMEMERRVLSFWSDVIKKEPTFATIGIITHGGVIRIIKAMIDGIPLKESFSIKISYGEVLRIEV